MLPFVILLKLLFFVVSSSTMDYTKSIDNATINFSAVSNFTANAHICEKKFVIGEKYQRTIRKLTF